MEAEVLQALAEGLRRGLFAGNAEGVLGGAGEALDDLDAVGFEGQFEGDATVSEGTHRGQEAGIDADAEGHKRTLAFADDAGGGEGEGRIDGDNAGAEGECGAENFGIGAEGANLGDGSAERGPAGGTAFGTREINADDGSCAGADAVAPRG